jgi:hypothetical protein
MGQHPNASFFDSFIELNLCERILTKENVMSKKNAKKKNDKTKPAKTMKEKKQAKREKKEQKKNPGIPAS